MNNEALNPKQTRSPEEFQTDTQKIIHRHLKNEEDVITDEDIRNVRIGVTPSHQEDSEQNGKRLIAAIKDENKKDENNDADENNDPITPWDMVQP